MLVDELVVDHDAHLVFADELDLVHFMRRAEAIEEMNKRNPRLERSCMRYQGQVLCSLDRRRGKQRKSGRPGCHNVLVVTEDRQCLSGERPSGDVKHRRRQLACNLVHIGQHQHQALRRRKGRRQCAGLQGPVRRAGRPALTLHLYDVGYLAPDVGLAPCRPHIG